MTPNAPQQRVISKIVLQTKNSCSVAIFYKWKLIYFTEVLKA